MTRLDSPDTCDNDMDQKSSVYSAHNDPMRDIQGGWKLYCPLINESLFLIQPD